MVEEYYKADQYHAGNSIGYLVRHASRMITMQVESLFTEKDVTFVQWVVLMHLRDGLSRTSAELCHNICYDSGALTRLVEQLQSRGLINRQRNEEDRRTILLSLTPLGIEVLEKYLPLIVNYYNKLFRDFSQEEADTFISMLKRLQTTLVEPQKMEG